MNTILLQGCSTTPLASYLKALGILRLVAEQADPEARGSWSDEGFLLDTRLGQEQLEAFLLNDYRPTPILAPWNGGSGFYPGKDKDGFGPVRQADAPRFQGIRQTMEQIQHHLEQLGLSTKPDNISKENLLRRLRNELNEEALAWLDAVFMLTTEGPKYPPLLGTGGNDGNLEFSVNFLQQLVMLFDPETGAPTDLATRTLPGALYAAPVILPGKGAIGQFAPGNAGGPNSTTAYKGDALTNGWDFVLMLEGALLFAASVTRRQESSQTGQLSYPFTVRLSGSGSGNTAISDEANARAEIWLPIWNRSAGLTELQAILGEGRATLGKRTCRDGLDFARAVAQLGVDRGISAFQRYAFVMRSGKAYLATPLSKFQVQHTPQADLVNDLESHQWLSRLRQQARHKEAPASLRSTAQRLENALFDLTRQPATTVMQNTLTRVGDLALWQAHHRKGRDASPLLPPLSGRWLIAADDHSDAYRLAAALASLGAGTSLPMRAHIYPLDRKNGFTLASSGESAACTWSQGRLAGQLATLLRRRLLESARLGAEPTFSGATPTDLSAIHALLFNPTLDARIANLLPALVLLKQPFALPERNREAPPLPLAYRLIKPLFCDPDQLRNAGILGEDQSLRLPPEIPRLLAANRLDAALQLALRRLRIAGLNTPALLPNTEGMDGRRLLSALLVPISTRALRQLANNTFKSPDNQLETA